MKFNLLKNKEKNANLNSIGPEQIREKSTGRSMVEMLGVLAIIGVLSIGGISGYTIAMRRYKANEIIATAGKYALTIYTQMQNLMLNDPNTYYINFNTQNNNSSYSSDLGTEGYWMKNGSPIQAQYVVAFSNSGLGSLPTGLKDIYLDRIVTNNSGDLVVLSLRLEDVSLCKTIFSITGDKLYGYHTECIWDDNPFARITFIMD